MMGNPAWYIAAILLLLASLMGFHLMSLWVAVIVCFDYAEKVIDPAVTVVGAEGIAGYCDTLNTNLQEAVDKYLSVLLSLIGGAGVSGVYAASTSRKDDEP